MSRTSEEERMNNWKQICRRNAEHLVKHTREAGIPPYQYLHTVIKILESVNPSSPQQILWGQIFIKSLAEEFQKTTDLS